MRKIRFSKFYMTVVAISLGSGFQHGYHTGVTNIPTNVLKTWIQQIKTHRLSGVDPTDKEVRFILSLIVALFPVGGILGGSLTGYFLDRWGRKKSLLLINLIMFMALLLMSSAKRLTSFEIFMFGRLLAGLYAGISGGVCQIYLTEIAPDKIRGAIASTYHLGICGGIWFAQLAGLGLATEKSWIHLFTIPFFPLLCQVITLSFCRESPKYLLMTKDKERRAKRALAWYRGTDDLFEEMEEMKNEDDLVKQLHLIKQRSVGATSSTRQIYLCIVLSIGQQLCGVNCIVYFSKEFAEEKDLGLAAYATIVFGFVLVASAAVTVFLVDRIGRRCLMMTSFMGMACTSLIISLTLIVEDKPQSPFYMKYFAFLGIVLYLVAYCLGAGPIPWFITAEIFNYSTKSAAVSTTSVVNWGASLLVISVFLPLKQVIGYYAFMVFVILDCFFFCYVVMHLPETSQKSARKIIEMFN